MPKKITFLDIDGVLNSLEHPGPREKLGDELNRVKIGMTMIDEYHINYLNQIIAETDAYIVVSSTWRLMYYSVLPKILNNKGFYKGEAEKRIIDRTPVSKCSMCCRGNEINDWLKNNNQYFDGVPYYSYKNYVILDDDQDMLLCQKNNFVNTSWEKGLEQDHVIRAIEILNKDYGEL